MRRIVARQSSVAPSRMALYLVHRPPARIRRHFVMVRRVRADRKRQSMAIHNRHDFHAFSALRWSDFQPAARHNEGCVDEAFFFVQRASMAKLVGNIRQHATQNLIAAPSLKAPMHSFVVRVALRRLC